MDLEKVASELAQKAVAVRNSDTRLAPGEYPAWASEFKKLAEEHYAELGLAKEAAGEGYNPYSRYDQAVQGNELMSNPLVRNALVTGGLGAGVGALGSLASNLFSKKKKKRYLTDALSSGLVGGLTGGLGGAGYTALTDGKATNDLVNQAARFFGADTTPPATRNEALKGEKAKIEKNTMNELTPEGKSIANYIYGGAAATGASVPAARIASGIYNNEFGTRADTKKLMSHAEQQLNAFRDSLADKTSKGKITGNRQQVFDNFMQGKGLYNPAAGRIVVTDPKQLAQAMSDLGKLNTTLDFNKNPLRGTINTDQMVQQVMGTGGKGSPPGVLQAFSNPELVQRRMERAAGGRALSGTEAGAILNKAYGSAPTKPSAKPTAMSAKSKTLYDGRAFGKALRPGLRTGGAAGLAAGGTYMLAPWLNNNTQARAQNTADFLNNLRQNLANSDAPEVAADKEQRLQALDNLIANVGGSLERKDVNRIFDALGSKVVPEKGKK